MWPELELHGVSIFYCKCSHAIFCGILNLTCVAVSHACYSIITVKRNSKLIKYY